MSLTALNLECPVCAVPFLAPDCSPSARVQCPHCGEQHLRSRCREAGAEAWVQQKISTIRTAEEEYAEIRDESRNQQAKLLLGAGAIVAVLGLGAYAAVSFGAAQDEKAEKAKLAATAKLESAETARYDAAFTAAKKALASSDWQTLLRSVRSRERALAQATWVYAREPYQPMHLIDYKFPQDMHVGEDAFVRLYVTAEGIDTGFWIRLQNSGYGWLLDWEALGGYTREHWEAFLEERPERVEQYRVHMQRSSIPDRHFYERGFTGDGDAFGIRIWALDPEQHVHAIIVAESSAGRALMNRLRWEVGEGFIARLSWPENAAPEAGYHFVNVEEVVQPGWHITDSTNAPVK